ncbi:type I-C CRISPR-associated protein Cas7/Csd2 [Afifella marina]|uniref:CRISPR-associated protein, Csd2 family n=1 Tax=Afifella marina DSM 2698 TaxID=1120955 RepID=A0A1G5P6G2_AFIMA|nr:type I-C CRISPR-associated protein Cas7/Csd2 [Afifella marina]MBK1624822.1 type I-C CRISPR-associated protein Cas7/Csd2 [Afifella marina DSM 2698]MBK1628416.1 type I-C CRISPR-associated protein Cas7/Csd2 [Afifella marina]MBK5917903.1 type I-C CRISPR-associated protein Cas7/Csd2 [Afifella marina]RAI18756.1 type I-C CRISPR-associated protein Cas7/Csd2 [Afifella marina DSM 2698]SCZ45142.1 CRISPR-associated protein, Csd2 family [Afifella marina DSM 2698]
MPDLAQRHDFVLIFDVKNGNPNGDPDAGNLPRLDPETGHGLVSDVSLKRKIRNYMEIAHRGESGRAIYVQEGAILNEKHREAYRAIRPGEKVDGAKLNPHGDEEADKLRRFMCDNFFDVRTFGAVMSTGINCGQVRGPVQMTFAQSAEPIVPQEISITRMAATTAREKEERREGEADDDNARTENRTMGRKHIVPYGLYRAHGFISAKLAERTGFSDDDLALLMEALEAMFEHDHSAARGEMATRKLIVFRHATALGNAPAHSLFDRVKIWRTFKGETYEPGSERLDNAPPARAFSDYAVTIDRENLPDGVEIIERL